MKKILLLITLLVAFWSASAQLSKGSICLSAYGNYLDGGSESGIWAMKNSTSGQYLNTGVFADYFFADHFFIGLGFDFSWTKESQAAIFYGTLFQQAELMKVRSRLLVPSLNGGYHRPITDKLSFDIRVGVGYAFNSSESKAYYVWDNVGISNGAFSTEPMINQAFEMNSDDDYGFLSATISPELTYSFSKQVGAYLGCGGLGLAMMDWKIKQSSWIVNMNPTHWNVGIRVAI
jgi:hypothetical protein